MITLTCEICGKEFQVSPYRENKARFCSYECSGKWHMQNRSMPNDHKIGNKFREGKRPANAFTSEQVRGSNNPRWTKGIEFTCHYCGKIFEIKKWVINQNKSKSGLRFCSKDCHSKYMSESMSGNKSPLWVGGPTTYRGKGWIEARKSVVYRDNGTCQECGKFVGKSIPVHHIIPFRSFDTIEDANSIDNLICLCQSCHMKIESRK